LYLYYASHAPRVPLVDGKEGYDPTTFPVGISGRQIELSVLSKAFKSAEYGGDAGYRVSDQVDGTLLGQLNFWVADPSASKSHRPAVRPLSEAVRVPSKTADPDAVSCKKGLQMFFAVLPTVLDDWGRNDQGLGMWHATALPGGLELYNSSTGKTVTTLYGRDFVSAPTRKGYSADHLGGAGPKLNHIDPDAVELADGTWRVFGGAATETELVVFSGKASDGCTDWESAWKR
jgi:hypothetical protein